MEVSLTTFRRLAPFVYSEEGRKVAGVLWDETMAELPIDERKLAEVFSK